MLINLSIEYTPLETGGHSECAALVKALDQYKCDYALASDDPTLLYVVDSLLHKLTLALVNAVEQLSNEAQESRAV